MFSYYPMETQRGDHFNPNLDPQTSTLQPLEKHSFICVIAMYWAPTVPETQY